MPGVDIYFTHVIRHEMVRITTLNLQPLREVDTQVRTSIKASVRRFGAALFTVDERRLDEKDFSFKFHQPEVGDELTNDIIVRVRLHAFEERRQNLNDAISAEMAYYITQDLADFFPSRAITVGVELMLAEVMWGTASTMD